MNNSGGSPCETSSLTALIEVGALFTHRQGDCIREALVLAKASSAGKKTRLESAILRLIIAKPSENGDTKKNYEYLLIRISWDV